MAAENENETEEWNKPTEKKQPLSTNNGIFFFPFLLSVTFTFSSVGFSLFALRCDAVAAAMTVATTMAVEKPFVSVDNL